MDRSNVGSLPQLFDSSQRNGADEPVTLRSAKQDFADGSIVRALYGSTAEQTLGFTDLFESRTAIGAIER